MPISVLRTIDREAVRAYYDSAHLAGWSRLSEHIADSVEHAKFGVAMRNGYAEPWAHGRAPLGPLSANRALTGSVTWSGSLVGFTPSPSSVIGDATISLWDALTIFVTFGPLWEAGGSQSAPVTCRISSNRTDMLLRCRRQFTSFRTIGKRRMMERACRHADPRPTRTRPCDRT